MNDTPKVTYRRLGKSGLQVSVPILGCMSMGSSKWMRWAIDEEEALPILKAAWDMGVTTWDTANLYSNGMSERIIGKAIKQFDIPRHRIIILTKCNGLVMDEIEGLGMADSSVYDHRDYVNNYGLSRQAIFNQVDASLERLGTSYIDLLQIHRADLDKATAKETMKALHDLVQCGKVRYIGASSMWAWQLAHYNHVAEMNGWTTFVSMQNSMNLMYREEEREMVPFAQHAGIGLIPWGPLNAGRLARPLDAEDTIRTTMYKQVGLMTESEPEDEIVRRVTKLSQDKGWTMAQVSLAWIWDKVTSPIVGVSSVKRLEEAILPPDYRLTDEEVKYLEEPYRPLAVRGHT